MAKEIIDIYIEAGYPYDFVLNYNDASGGDLEAGENCFFYTAAIGTKQFSVVDNEYSLTILEAETNDISNLDEYVVYTVNNTTSEKSKLLSGRIHIDKQIRS